MSRSKLFVVLLGAAIMGCSHGGRSGTSSTAAVTPAATATTTTQTTTTPTTPTTTLVTTTPLVSPTTTPTTPTTSTNPHLLYALGLINAARIAHGLNPFTLDPLLCACALRHSIDWDTVCANQIASAAFNAHNDFKNGDTCGADAENQGVGQGAIDDAFKTVFDSMMAEGAPNPGGCNHYGNLMNPLYTRIGIGEYQDGINVWITEEFAR